MFRVPWPRVLPVHFTSPILHCVKYILSLDQGTTSSRSILFDKNGSIVASDQYEFKQMYPKPGWVEHDPQEIWQTQSKSIDGALQKAKASWEDVAGVGITNQRETIALWDKETGKPVGNAIVWQDRRTADICSQLKEDGREDWIQETTGLLLDPYFSATKIKWLLENNPRARELADANRLAIGTMDSWLIWNLSEGASHVTDVSNASRTLLMNLESCQWDDELLNLFQIPRDALPDIVDSSGELAMVSQSIASRDVSIAGIAGDQQAALFGQLCFEPGMLKCTYGTGCFILLQVGDALVASRNRLLSTVAWRMNGKTEYALEGSVFVGGAAVQWLRDELKIIENSPDVEALASQVEDSGGVVVIPAFTGLGAPYWDPHARGAVLGLTRGSSQAHIARATLEGIAYQVADVAEAMEKDSENKIESLQADGGASANSILMQTQADLLNARVVRPKVVETTALGAAFLAGLGVGFWSSKDELLNLIEPDREFEPLLEEPDRKRNLVKWRKAVDRIKNWGQD